MPNVFSFWKKKETAGMIPKVGSSAIVKHKMKPKEVANFIKQSTASIDVDFMADESAFRKAIITLLTKSYPVASQAVWIWKYLCATDNSIQFVSGTSAQRDSAKDIITELNSRINVFEFMKSGGLPFLAEQFFQGIFKYGRFSGKLIVDPKKIEIQDFLVLDPFNIKFSRGDRKAFYKLENSDQYFQANPNTFFYYGLNMDWDNPYGWAMIESSYTLMKIADEMLDDMKNSSSNAGIPRLHIKIAQPKQMENEDGENYVERASSYFDAYIKQFSEIGNDDNFYSWDDVTIGVVGGNSQFGYTWKTNRNVLDEEIIAGFHLFPWVVGKSAATTKNWVQSQFDMLMSQTKSIQLVGRSLTEWIANTELKLKGLGDVRAVHVFDAPRDPARKDIAEAIQTEISNALTKAKEGIISPDDAARELGYDKAHDPTIIENATKKTDKVG
jgi:hypothetical protein